MDRIIQRIQKLLALSSSENEHEAALAANMVQDLLAKHNLSMRDLNEAQLEKETEITEEAIISKRRMPGWYTTLVIGVANAFGCQVVVGTGYRRTTLRVVGTKRDVIVAQLMFEYLAEVITRIAKRDAHGMGRPFVASFKDGMATRLSTRVKRNVQVKRDKPVEVTDAQVEGLILMKKDKIAKWMKRYNAGHYSGHLNGGRDSWGYNAGSNAADSVNLSDQIKGGKVKGYLN